MFPRVPALYREGATIEIGDFFYTVALENGQYNRLFAPVEMLLGRSRPPLGTSAHPPPLGYELIGVPSLSAEAFHYAIVVETESDTYWQDPRRVSL